MLGAAAVGQTGFSIFHGRLSERAPKGFGKIGRIRKAAAIGDFGHGAVGFDQQLFRRVQAIGDKVFDWTLMQTALKAAQVSRWLICAQAAIWASVSFSA